MPTIAITDDSFEADVLKAEGPVLVDFWAEWCGPCKQIGPTLEELSDDKTGQVTVAKINIDENPMTPSKYGVRGIPTMMLFKDGQVISMANGAKVTMGVKDGKYTINGAKILGSARASNGMLHIIDAVLLPPAKK